jgi:Putative auto-transporter adhesin, head GIN domain
MSIKTEVRSVSGFNKVRVRGYGSVFLQQGDRESLIIEADEEVLPKIISEVSEGRLTLGFRTEWWDWITQWFSLASLKDKTINYRMEIKEIEQFSSEGSTSLTAERLQSKAFELSSSGSADVSIKEIDCDQLTTRVSGASKMNLAGSARKHVIQVSGSTNINAEELETQETNLKISGSGMVKLNVVQALNANISGAGEVRYRGQPKVSQQISGSGRIQAIKTS